MYLGFWAAVTGAVCGSFVCCMTERIYDKRTLGGRSRCPGCGRTLGVMELIPVFSWLIQKGRCRYCRERIPTECLWSEISLAVFFTAAALRFDAWNQKICAAGLGVILLEIALWDKNTYEIPGGLLAAALHDAVSKVWCFCTGRTVGVMSDWRQPASFIGLHGPEHEERNDWLRRYPPFICSRLLSGTEGQFSESVFQ